MSFFFILHCDFVFNIFFAAVRYSYRKYREMIFLKEGKFWMGTNDPDSKTGEYPMRNVAVKSFYFDTNPVINAEYW